MPRPQTFAVAILATLTFVGCDEPAKPAAKPAATQPTTQVATERVPCVPCGGHKFALQANTPRVTYEGEIYYFCTPGCEEEFNENPKKFATAAEPTTQPNEKAG